jgi:PTS system galactitol-specific IIB component
MMKKLLIMCGTGVATSTVVTNKVREWLETESLLDEVTLFQGKIADELGRIDDYDIVISTTIVPAEIQDRVIMGLPLLTGIGIEELFDTVRQKIQI